MRDKMAEFKDQLCNEHLVPIEDRIREFWPGQDVKVTLLIRMPWLKDGGILITNDSIEDALAEVNRLREKEIVR